MQGNAAASALISDAAHQFGINLEKDADLVWVAEEVADTSILPAGWKVYTDEVAKRAFYNNQKTGRSTWEHPLAQFFRGVVFMARGGREKLDRAAARDPPTKTDVDSMLEYMELVNPPEGVREVAKQAVSAPLMPGWQECTDDDGDPAYKNTKTGKVQSEHPLDAYFAELAVRCAKEPRRWKLYVERGAAVPPLKAAVPSRPSSGRARQADQDSHGPDTARGQNSARSARGQDSARGRDRPRGRDSAVSDPSNQAQPRAPADAKSTGGPPKSPRQQRQHSASKTPAERHPSAGRAPGVESSSDSDPESMSEAESEEDTAVEAAAPSSRRSQPPLFPPVHTMVAVDEDMGSLRAITRTTSRAASSGKNSEENILVCVRVRPLERGLASAWQIDQAKGVISLDSQCASQLKRAPNFFTTERGINGATSQSFVFDAIHDKDVDNVEVYSASVQKVVDSALEGVNGTIFAYGQTGSGKTHTILGTRASPGLVSVAVTSMFSLRDAAEDDREYSFKVGMLEIYNEELRDLLAAPDQRLFQGTRLAIKEDLQMGVVVAGLQEEEVCDVDRVRTLLAKGTSRRQVGATKMNEMSSRSHTIFRILVESRSKAEDEEGTIRVATLSFVDLAGSERLSKTGAEGARAVESAQINLSLLALGNVISSLSEGNGRDFVPYRNSKLTRILQPSLGGNARTTIVANIQLDVAHAEETVHTLRFAARATKVTNRVVVNEVLSVEATLRRYQHEIGRLKSQLQQQARLLAESKQGASFVALSRNKLEIQDRLSELELENLRLQDRLDTAQGLNHVGDEGTEGHKGKDGQKSASMVKMMALVARAAGVHVGRGGGGGAGSLSQEELLSKVRQLRFERDELKHSGKQQSALHSDVRALQEQLEEMQGERVGFQVATDQLEEAAPLPPAEPRMLLGDRLLRAVQATALALSDVAALKQQRDQVAGMCREANEREDAMRSRLEGLHDAAQQGPALRLEVAALRQQRDEWCERAGGDPTVNFASEDAVSSDSRKWPASLDTAVTQRMQELETQVRVHQGLLLKAEAERAAAVKGQEEALTLGEGLGAEELRRVMGTVDQALRDRAEAQAAVTTAQREGAKLNEQLRVLEQEGAGREDGGAVEGGSHAGEVKALALNEKLKMRIYALSKELAEMTRARDVLQEERAQKAQQDFLIKVGVVGEAGCEATPPSTGGDESVESSVATTQGDADVEKIPFNIERMLEAAGKAPPAPERRGGRSDLSQCSDPDPEEAPAESPDLPRKAVGKKKKGAKPLPEWNDGVGEKEGAENDLHRLRKRAVAAEKARQDAVTLAAAQQRAAKLNFAHQSKQLQEREAQLEEARTEAGKALAEAKLQKEEIQRLTLQLAAANAERDVLHGDSIATELDFSGGLNESYGMRIVAQPSMHTARGHMKGPTFSIPGRVERNRTPASQVGSRQDSY
ncbi:hypothetical protein CYMTET_48037 [Cymbomonas tetramitiformis]|uniref:Kinesin-like protein n=1 Tax=Cymbomonas tetramitiformis TaxID=36881 RepID=A0AAE0BUT3_9CHLO|nr:hypothetical protein CYMTET_48037 [Cymbomonas tetramitiformis]